MNNEVLPIPNHPNWPCSSIAEVSEFVARGTAPVYVDSSDVLAIGQRCVTEAGFDPAFARSHDHRRMRGVLLPRKGDVLVNSTGTGTIGRSCVFNSSGRFIIDGHVTVIRPRQDVADGRWIESVIRSYWGQSFLEGRCYSGSTNQVEFSRGRFSRALIPLPALAEQHSIADILHGADESILSVQRLIAKLEQARLGLLSEFLPPSIGENKCGWRWLALNTCVSSPITYGIVQAGPNVEGGVPYIRTGDMSGNQLEREGLLCTSRQIASSFTRSRVRRCEIVCAIRATVGKVLPVPEELDGANLTQGTARISPAASFDPVYLLWALRGQSVQRQFGLAVKGTTFSEITLAQLREIRVPVPGTIAEQQHIAMRMSAADEGIAREVSYLSKLRLLKQGLMDDLLTGRVRVSV